VVRVFYKLNGGGITSGGTSVVESKEPLSEDVAHKLRQLHNLAAKLDALDARVMNAGPRQQRVPPAGAAAGAGGGGVGGARAGAGRSGITSPGGSDGGGDLAGDLRRIGDALKQLDSAELADEDFQSMLAGLTE
jgi:hypothetical protein